MKLFFVVLVLLFSVNNALAIETGGKIGFGLRGGYSMIRDARVSDSLSGGNSAQITIDNDFAYNGNVIFGLPSPNDSLAVELEATYSRFQASYTGVKLADIDQYDVAIGLQTWFNNSSRSLFSPYLGLGFDMLMYDVSNVNFLTTVGPSGGKVKIDSTFGAHAKLGFDYFFNNRISLNGEIKGVWGAMTDMKNDNGKIAHFNPSTFTALLGVRYFIR